MENTRDKSSESHSKRYQKDYTKLEAIFDAAVKRSRRKKIIYYASDRLYSENSRREIAQNSYKAVAWAEPLEEKDIHTEIIDLANKAGLVQMAPSRNDDKELLAFIMNPDHPEAQKSLTSKEVLKAPEESNDKSNELPAQENITVLNTQETKTEETNTESLDSYSEELHTKPSSENEQDFLARYYKTKQEVLGKLEHNSVKPIEPVEETSEAIEKEFLSEEEPEVSIQTESFSEEEPETSLQSESLSKEKLESSIEPESLSKEEQEPSIEPESLSEEEPEASIEPESLSTEEQEASIETEFLFNEEPENSFLEELLSEEESEIIDQAELLPEEETEITIQEEQEDDEAVELRSLLETLTELEEESTDEVVQEIPLAEEENLLEENQPIPVEESSVEEENFSQIESFPDEESLIADNQESENSEPFELYEIYEEVSLNETPILEEEKPDNKQETQDVNPEQPLEPIIEMTVEPEETETDTQTESYDLSEDETIPLESIEFFIEENKEVPHEATNIDNVTNLNDQDLIKEPPIVQEEPDSKLINSKSEKDLVVTEALTYENVHKDYSASTVSAICSLAVLAIFVLLSYQNFLGFDYIALVLTLVGIFLAWDMRSRSLIILCIIMLLTLIACMMVWVNQTRVIIDYIHYFWFFLIPLCMGVSYAYFNSKKALDNFNKQGINTNPVKQYTAPEVVKKPSSTPEKLDLKTIINDISEDESSLDYRDELSQDYTPVSYSTTQDSDTSEKTVDINIDSTPNWSFYQLAENPDLLNYEASLEDYMPSIEQETEEDKESTFEETLTEDEKESTVNIPNLRDFISVEKFGLSEEELNESLKTQDTGPVIFSNISRVRINEFFEMDSENQDKE